MIEQKEPPLFEPMPVITSGVIVPVVTPFLFSDICPLIDHIIEGKVSMIFLLGTTGEALKLQQERKKELIKKVGKHLQNRAKLLVGITSPTISDTLELWESALEAKAAAAVIAPAYLSQDCSSVIEKLLTTSSGNLLLYNYPALTAGQPIPIEQIIPFLDEPRLLGIKDSSGDFAYLDTLLRIRKERRFKIYYGRERNLQEALKRKIDGFVPGNGNVEPKLACALWEKKENGPWKDWQKLKIAIQNISPENYIQGLKLLLKDQRLISDARLFE